jgi:hypothetical protein
MPSLKNRTGREVTFCYVWYYGSSKILKKNKNDSKNNNVDGVGARRPKVSTKPNTTNNITSADTTFPGKEERDSIGV